MGGWSSAPDEMAVDLGISAGRRTAPGETCFAGTPCGAGGVIAIGDTCRICPDSTSQGILSWVEIEVEIDESSTSTTCGDLDYGLLLSVTKDSKTAMRNNI